MTERQHIEKALEHVQKAIIATSGGSEGAHQLRRLQLIRNDLRVARDNAED